MVVHFSERLAAMQECQRQIAHWTGKFEELRAQHRRACQLLRRTEEDPNVWWDYYVWDVADGNADKEFVVAALQGDPLFFGCLREGQPFTDKMAPALHNDPDVLLTFAESMVRRGDVPEDFETEYFNIPIPDELRRNKDFMFKICAIEGNHYSQATEELKVDPELALLAFSHAYGQYEFIRYLPEALLRNLDFLLKLVSAIEEYYDDMIKAAAPFLDVENQRALVLAIAEKLTDRGACCETECVPLMELDETIRDDKFIMEKFVRVMGSFLVMCSDRLKVDAEFVRLAVKNDPGSVQYALGDIRDELLADVDLMSKAIESSYGSGNILALAPKSIQEDKKMVLAAANKRLKYSNLPDLWKKDEEVVLALLHALDFKFDELCESFQTRDFF